MADSVIICAVICKCYIIFHLKGTLTWEFWGNQFRFFFPSAKLFQSKVHHKKNVSIGPIGSELEFLCVYCVYWIYAESLCVFTEYTQKGFLGILSIDWRWLTWIGTFHFILSRPRNSFFVYTQHKCGGFLCILSIPMVKAGQSYFEK